MGKQSESLTGQDEERPEQEEHTEQKQPRRWRHNLYDHIHVSVGTMNIVVIALTVLLVIALIIGIFIK